MPFVSTDIDDRLQGAAQFRGMQRHIRIRWRLRARRTCVATAGGGAGPFASGDLPSRGFLGEVGHDRIFFRHRYCWFSVRGIASTLEVLQLALSLARADGAGVGVVWEPVALWAPCAWCYTAGRLFFFLGCLGHVAFVHVGRVVARGFLRGAGYWFDSHRSR